MPSLQPGKKLSVLSPCPVTYICGVFSNRVFPLYPSRQLRAMSVDCIALTVSRIPLSNYLREGNTYLALAFYLAVYGFAEKQNSLCMGN